MVSGANATMDNWSTTETTIGFDRFDVFRDGGWGALKNAKSADGDEQDPNTERQQSWQKSTLLTHLGWKQYSPPKQPRTLFPWN